MTKQYRLQTDDTKP